jgi:hypothetical protein
MTTPMATRIAIEKLVTSVDSGFSYYWSASEGRWLDTEKMDERHLWKSILKHQEVRFLVQIACHKDPTITKVAMRIVNNIESALLNEWMKRKSVIDANWFTKPMHRTFIFNPEITMTLKDRQRAQFLWESVSVDKWTTIDHGISQRASRWFSVEKIVTLSKL